MAALTALAGFGVLLVATPHFNRPDDTALEMILSGSGALGPEPFSVYIHTWLGEVISYFYALFPHFPVYATALFFCSFLYYFSAAYGVTVTENWGWKLGCLLIYFISVQGTELLSLSFTAAAFYLTGSGVFFILFSELDNDSERHQRRLRVVGIVCVLLGALYRWNSALLTLAEFTPLLVGTAFVSAHRKRALRRVITTIGICAIGILAFNKIDHYRYESRKEWADFLHLYELTNELHDFGTVSFTRETISNYSNIGWSKAKIVMLLHNFIDGDHLGSTSSLQRLFDAASRPPSPSWEVVSGPLGSIRQIPMLRYSLCFLLLFLLLFTYSTGHLVVLFFTFFCQFLLLLAVSIRFKFSYTVVSPLLCSNFPIVLLLFFREAAPPLFFDSTNASHPIVFLGCNAIRGLLAIAYSWFFRWSKHFGRKRTPGRVPSPSYYRQRHHRLLELIGARSTLCIPGSGRFFSGPTLCICRWRGA